MQKVVELKSSDIGTVGVQFTIEGCRSIFVGVPAICLCRGCYSKGIEKLCERLPRCEVNKVIYKKLNNKSNTLKK
jgi:hypothetical protein